ncbi:MAG: sugar phosphate nucleotidyltransferase [Oscillospiraceae bacterium]|nr:sugar phosphate nucleotidyltransferase [Oscillospiraceae bacterium]
MKKKPVLVVMAAGMGSRYGGLKQIDPVGSQGEAILDYSLYDAYQAGFETAVIIIKEAIRQDFMDTVGKRLEKCPMEIRYAYQELTMLPQGYSVPEGRVKPWGTCHAVLSAREAIGGAPFAVLNADDFYGKSAFQTIFNQLSNTEDPYSYCMVGYEVSKTVTEHGGVTRGICKADDKGYLTKIVETTGIEKYPGGIRMPNGGGWVDLDPKTLVSMNLLGFMPSFLEEIETHFPAFLNFALKENPMKGEFLLPTFVGQLISEGRISMKVLSSPDKWFGVTYAADKPMVVAALKAMTQEGKYPDGLWK